jgi:integrase/recombinase XerD
VLNLYRRHLAACKLKGRKKKNCSCPIWAEGILRGRKIRQSLDLRNWEAANLLMREWEIHAPENTMKLADATDRFIADAKSRLRPPSILKYEQSIKALKESLGNKMLRNVTVDDVRTVRESWSIAPITMKKRLETVKAFFKFCVASGWLEKSPAGAIKAPEYDPKPTLPFSSEEIKRIFAALEEKYLEAHPFSNEVTKRKIKAFILVMLYSGIRISDCVFLKRDRIKDGKLFLYTHKTRVPVWVPLPPETLTALEECGDGEFYFSTGRGTVKTWTTEWEERLKKVFVLAALPEGHSHQLRDTFSVRLLLKGVPMETVATLLGNTLKVVETHYAPWVEARQLALAQSVRGTWD